MSENKRFYAQKMAEQKAAREAQQPRLRGQLEELFSVVAQCERIWALEERIERSSRTTP